MLTLAHTFTAYSFNFSKQCLKNSHVYYRQLRCLNLLECDSKKLLKKYGVNVQNFITVNENEDIKNAMQNMNFKAEKYVIKAQISAGGRGRGMFDNGYQGGVHIADNTEAIEKIARKMIGHRLVTKQTTASGIPVKKVMIADCLNIRHESYFCITLDSSYGGPIIIASKNGGTDIEEIYKTNSDSIKIFPLDITKGITNELCNNIVKCLGFSSKLHHEVSQQIMSMWTLLTEIDAVQLEINPFVETENNEIIAVDAKITFDDNAFFRQQEIEKLHEEMKNELEETENKALKYNLNYIKLDGNIGCLVNGAGLAMATMDIIKLYGGKPANFLDVGGNVTEIQVVKAMKILQMDNNVKSVLINVFGGIVDCMVIVNGIIRARKEIGIDKPLILRLEGNNNEKAKEVITQFDSNFGVYVAEDLHEAVQLVVASILI